ncbi:MAG: hypothetical protein GY711_12020 [bacterium]|nr:hypothetical protein [bacterium]
MALGNVLADYVDAGGGVVLAQFALTPARVLEGRWDQGYEVMLASPSQQGGNHSLGVVHLPGHPVMNGVSSFAGGSSSYRPTQSNLAPGAVLIADWTDGVPLVVEGANPRRIDLGFYPASSACSSNWWVETTDGDLLMANALLSAATIYSLYCSPAQPNSTGIPASIAATGSRYVVDQDITLIAEDLPPNEFGYFIVGSNQGQFQPPGSMGVICLTCGFQGCSGIGRYNRPGEIIQGPVGSLVIDLGALPLSPSVSVQPGETWNFQCWYRDLGSSNFTDAISIDFL